jgi:hypothetical protein
MIKSESMRWTRHVARMGEMRNKFNILVIKPEGLYKFGYQRITDCRCLDCIRLFRIRTGGRNLSRLIKIYIT